jgi:hypothetical protein
LISLAFVRPAQANIIMVEPQSIQNDENILFPDQDVVDNPIYGRTNQSHLDVRFDSNEDLVAPSGGQARIEAFDGELTQMTISIPGESFTTLVLNLNTPQGREAPDCGNPNNPACFVDFTAIDTDGAVFLFANLAVGNGENRFGFRATDGQSIASVSFNADAPISFIDTRQIRIGGAVEPGTQSVPEPASILLVGSALGGLALRRRRSRSVR